MPTTADASSHAGGRKTVDLDYFAGLGAANHTFDVALALIRERGMSLAQAVRTLNLLFSPRPRLDWALVGHPEGARSEAIVRAIDALASAVERGARIEDRDDGVASMLAQWPQLPSVAVFHDVIPLDWAEIVRVLGPDEVARRLRGFGAALRASVQVG